MVKLRSPLLSLAESQQARELQYWTNAQNQYVQEKIRLLCSRWCACWGLPEPSTTTVKALNDAQARLVLASKLCGTVNVASAVPRLQNVAESVSLEAWDDWQSRLTKCLGVSFEQITANSTLRTAWYGFLVVSLPWWEGQLTITLSPSVVRMLLDDFPETTSTIEPSITSLPLVPLHKALVNATAVLHVELAATSLTLGQLQSLRIGDVVPLAHRLDDPLTVWLHTPGDTAQPLCTGWLGRRNQRTAIELSH